MKKNRSNRVEAFLCGLIVSTLVSALVALFIEKIFGALGIEKLGYALLMTFCAAFLATLAIGPTRWIADPSISGSVGHDYPLLARIICVLGAIMFAGGAILMAI